MGTTMITNSTHHLCMEKVKLFADKNWKSVGRWRCVREKWETEQEHLYFFFLVLP